MSTSLVILTLLNILISQQNIEQTGYNREPITLNTELSQKATERANYLCSTNQFSHNNWTSSFSSSTSSYIGENLAKSFHNDIYNLFQAWINSPLHYLNLLDKNFKIIGVGENKECNIVVLLFADKY